MYEKILNALRRNAADEAMAESLANKQPLGEYRHDSLAAEEMITLANWCLMHYASQQAVESEA